MFSSHSKFRGTAAGTQVDPATRPKFPRRRRRLIGPTVMSGRIVDLDVSPHDPTHFYVAYASGGLWKTTSNGTSFTPIFEGQAAMTIGDIAVSWSDPEVVYVGTGENNSSRSSYSGTGVYHTSHGGEIWRHTLIIDDSTGVIDLVIDPNDTSILYAAAWHRQRRAWDLEEGGKTSGIFKSSDGGDSWTRISTKKSGFPIAMTQKP